MKIHLAADYDISAAFYPIYTLTGQLTAVELISWFSHETANVAIPVEMLIAQLTFEQRIALLQSQISLVEKHYDFFSHHDLHVAINIDEMIAQAILDSEFLLHKMGLLDCLELEINESFANLSEGRDNPLLAALSDQFYLSLQNFGAGKATPKAVYDNLFYRVKLDKTFIQHNIRRLSFAPFINAVLNNIAPHCQQIIVQGVDDAKGLEEISKYPFSGIQSALFPAVDEASLGALIRPPKELSDFYG
ncbi:EAL domain-containing protein [Erwiniaceae bacterium BAC15a-03b]|uniref:EAL domain-containing protein n=1 Tax=Winslowiella arboricola TaxID=2978220 RepID=A0A9J6PNM4_9GAMM|nr:EAL domain-containing protein [Winslowiella arboricola]MCU5774935.1 EAL domain-containing protein [Winslowiella arboricola]MCU5779913.1 EAL domain-containing protein [Winslowiella arboricola]